MFIHPTLTGTLLNGEKDFVASVNNTSIKEKKPANKNAMEFMHLQHFQERVKTQYPNLSFTDPIRSKTEPPDFYILRDGVESGIELTMLIFRDLRAEVKFFADIQDRLLAKYEEGILNNLAGITIEIKFLNHQNNRPSKIDDKVLDELIVSLNNLLTKPFEFAKIELGLGEDAWPLGQSGIVGDGFIQWDVTSMGYFEPKSVIGHKAGFEIAHTEKHYRKIDFFTLLQNTIDAKDVEKNTGNELLISSGMPDIDGWVTTIESTGTFIFLTEWLAAFEPPKYLKRIYLDSWGHNEVRILYDSDIVAN